MSFEATSVRNETRRWHDAYKDAMLRARRESSHRRKLARLGALSLPASTRLLDVACGPGEALSILHEQGLVDLTGTDVTIDRDLQGRGWAKLDESDACALPYPDASFDTVLCMHALHHLGGIVRIGRALDEWMRVLKAGGDLMIVDHWDSPQLRAAFWGLEKKWIAWPTRGMRSFREQLIEEHEYLFEYLDAWHAVPVLLKGLACDVRIDRRGPFFFYWTGRKR